MKKIEQMVLKSMAVFLALLVGFNFSLQKKPFYFLSPASQFILKSPPSLWEQKETVVKVLKDLASLRITEGCSQGCSHCFFSPKRNVQIMPFHRILQLLKIAKKSGAFSDRLNETEITLYQDNEIFDYYDRQADKDVGDVIAAILNYFPKQKINTTTRGWYLGDKIGPRAARKIAQLMEKYPDQISIRISIDLYNIQQDEVRYIYRVLQLVNIFSNQIYFALVKDHENRDKTNSIMSHILALSNKQLLHESGGGLFSLLFDATSFTSQYGRAKNKNGSVNGDVGDSGYGYHLFPDGRVEKKIKLSKPCSQPPHLIHRFEKTDIFLWPSAEAQISLLPKFNRSNRVIPRVVLNERLSSQKIRDYRFSPNYLIRKKIPLGELKKIVAQFNQNEMLDSLSVWTEEKKFFYFDKTKQWGQSVKELLSIWSSASQTEYDLYCHVRRLWHPYNRSDRDKDSFFHLLIFPSPLVSEKKLTDNKRYDLLEQMEKSLGKSKFKNSEDTQNFLKMFNYNGCPEIELEKLIELKEAPFRQHRETEAPSFYQEDVAKFIRQISEEIQNKEELKKIEEIFLQFLNSDLSMFDLVQLLREKIWMSQQEAQSLITRYLWMDKVDEVIDLRSPLAAVEASL